MMNRSASMPAKSSQKVSTSVVDLPGTDKCPLSLKSLDEPSVLGPLVISSPEAPEFEIWMVHGLTGNRRATWTHKDGSNEAFWPDFLAKDLPKAKITMYGYDANVIKFWKNACCASLQAYGQELASAIRSQRQEASQTGACNLPIYFIGHSLGGLVIEQALLVCLASKDASQAKIAADTTGVLFMGTPHQGSHLARWGRVLCSLIPEQLLSTNTQILKTLDRKSEVCRRLNKDFQREVAANPAGRLVHVRLHCFYELVKMPGLNVYVVDQDSAGIPGQDNDPINGDHVTMVQFPSPLDPGYTSVRGQLVAWLSRARESFVDDPRNNNKEQKKKKKKKKTAPSVSAVGAQFLAPISGGKVVNHQMAAGRDLVTGRHGRVTNHNYAAPPQRGGFYSSSSSSSGDDSGMDDSDDADDDSGGSDAAGSDSEGTLTNN